MKALLANLKQLGLPRLAALGGVGVAMLVLLGVLVLHGVNATNGLLYRDLEAHEAGEIVEQLAKAHIKYRLQDQGSTIMVPDDDVARARLLLAQSGLPSGGSVGYEIFDKGNSFTATQFEQTINETRALEGELERSIRLIHGVRNARVHLVLRHRELFSTDEQNAQASVLLSMDGGRRLDEESIAAVVNLVSAAVPGLDAHNISLIDNRGHVLLKQGEGNSNGGQSAEEQRQLIEQRIAREVEDLLGSSLGPGHVRVEANVTMNNDHVRETQENYDPDQQVLRSQQTKTEKSINTQGSTNTTVSNNLPNANAGQQQNGSQSNRQEQTNNYEISKTVRTLVQDQPRIARISMAVMVDGISQSDGKGHASWQPRNQEELGRLTALTKSAVGFDQSRGDVVTVMSMKFTDMDMEMKPETSGWSKFFTHSNQMEAIRFGLFAACLAMVLFFVVRPLLRPIGEPSSGKLLNFAASKDRTPAVDLSSQGAVYLPDSQSERARTPMLEAAYVNAEPVDEETVSVSGVQGRIRASSVQKVVDLVETHPSESIALVRGWLMPSQEGAGG
ncbi:flagellar basal-body MS-ring/collar protein FliF [Gluconobacter oxydans]|nr:flagellar basal-body MS-ring/collar protein FliF [Gluconobacter oxydans]KXV30667.1 flagellar MS-ring protein [Gluconobacter oxydans]MBF0856708.1 flagellar M-ring protein FliF [Gluconobacter oxydans]TCW24839.1 flagellar M-ring protein FliF [Gluconobacter oxydans]GEC61200.1 flagellar M-ring protein [Gluconobacter oxydans]